MQVTSFQGTKHSTPINTTQMDVLVREARSKTQQQPILCPRVQKETGLNKKTYTPVSHHLIKQPKHVIASSIYPIYSQIATLIYIANRSISIITVYHMTEYINISLAQNNLCTPFVLSPFEMRQMTFSSGWKKNVTFFPGLELCLGQSFFSFSLKSVYFHSCRPQHWSRPFVYKRDNLSAG